MRIGVSGAAGQLGKIIVAELSKRSPDAAIVGISRAPETVRGAEGRKGDYDVPETLVAAYAGLDRLIIIPSADLMPGVRAHQTVAAIDAAIAARVGQIYLLSAAGTREKDEPAIGAAYWSAEQHLIKNATGKWTILRMNFFSETLVEEAKMSLATGALAGLGDNRIAYVSRDDVGAAIAGALSSDGHSGAIYTLSGPAALNGDERASILSAASGKPLAYMTVSEAQLRQNLARAGLPEFIVEAITSMQLSFVDGAYDIVTGDVAKLAGDPPRSLADVVRSAF